MRKKESRGSYHFIVTIPDRLYPFRNKVGGQWVRGIHSYDRAIARAFRRYGHGHDGVGLFWYRQFFHFAGSLLFVYAATFITLDFFGSRAALTVALVALTLFIAYQEFVLQRRTYRQLWRKAASDWLVWCGPAWVYFFFFILR